MGEFSNMTGSAQVCSVVSVDRAWDKKWGDLILLSATVLLCGTGQLPSPLPAAVSPSGKWFLYGVYWDLWVKSVLKEPSIIIIHSVRTSACLEPMSPTVYANSKGVNSYKIKGWSDKLTVYADSARSLGCSPAMCKLVCYSNYDRICNNHIKRSCALVYLT